MKSILIAMAAGLFVVGSAAFAQQAVLAGRPAAGATVFKQCMACHQVGASARNGIGPVLNGVVGRRAGTQPGYNYSSANRNSGLVWDYQTLARYLRAPDELVPGTKMIFFGLKKSQDIADVIAYLKQFDADGKQSSQREVRRMRRQPSKRFGDSDNTCVVKISVELPVLTRELLSKRGLAASEWRLKCKRDL